MRVPRKTRTLALLLAAAVGLGTTGCMSIFFHNDGTESEYTDFDELHHIGVFSLVEFSDPVDLAEACTQGEWRTVKTERGPLAILVGWLTQPFYGPMTVGVDCR